MYESPACRFGVIGNPVSHSRSPEIHQYFGKEYGVFLIYRRLFSEEDGFEDAVSEFFCSGGRGLNVTLPFKQRAFALASSVSLRAQLVGAVNTLSMTSDGLFGDTTDGPGFMQDLERLGWLDAVRGHVVIFGAGGAVRSILPSILELNPKSITFVNRTSKKARGLIDDVESWRARLGFQSRLILIGVDEKLETKNTTLLIQGASSPLDLDVRPSLEHVLCYDLNYGDRAELFRQWASNYGAKQIQDGFGMLVAQAAKSFEIWTQRTVNLERALDELSKQNPWLEFWWNPPFHRVDIVQMQQAVVQRLEEKKQLFQLRLEALSRGDIPLTWDSLVRFYELLDDRLHRVWSALSHLNGVVSSDEVRSAYNELQPEVTDCHIQEKQNPLFKPLVEKLLHLPESDSFSPAQQKWCRDTLLHFRLAGADLDQQGQDLFAAIDRELAQLSNQFADNVLDATDAWFIDVDEPMLDGLPKAVLHSARETHKSAHHEDRSSRCRLTLHGPCYIAVMKHCHCRDIRKVIYEAYGTRASDKGPNAGEFDTSAQIQKILQLRQEQARLLGYDHFAAYSLATKMAKSAEQVIDFLHDLADKSRPAALRERDILETFAREQLGLDHLEPWDVAYASERLKQQTFDLDPDEVAQYFPSQQVLKGLFKFVEKLFGVHLAIDRSVPTYHGDVHFVTISKGGELLGGLYVDLYARLKKKGGAWMDECRQRHINEDGLVSLPIAFIVLNCSSPSGNQPSLMTHDEVVTLFHEMGHCLHHLLSRVDVAQLSGIQGVEWDAVEVPSQLLESWCYQEEVIAMLSAHFETQESLPKPMLEQLVAAKNFQAALSMMKQIEYALFDMSLHTQSWSKHEAPDFMAVLRSVQEKVAVLPQPDWHRFPNSFSHIFAGGYAAGYYGYKWAEVYAADIFSEFQRGGIFNSTLGQKLYSGWLSVGGSRSTEENFEEVMGRKLNASALLESFQINGSA